MFKKLLVLVICLTLVMSCAVFPNTANAATTFTNPLKYTDLPDPMVYRHTDGYYYGMGTTGGTCLVLYKSDKLTNLFTTGQSKVIWTPPASTDHSYDLWAPEITYLDGKWYVYYCAGNGDLATQRMFVISNANADPFTGAWTDHGKIYSPGADYWAIDGLVMKQNGNMYFVWSGYNGVAGDVTQHIYISKMSSPTTLTGTRVKLSSPTYSWERRPDRAPYVNEGPEILQRNGKTFIVYSGSQCGDQYYCLGMLTISSTADPMVLSNWTKSANPVFQSANGVYGPGHNGFAKSPDGIEDWIIYHARRSTNGAEIRTPRAQKFTWNADGTPNFGTPLPWNAVVNIPSGQTEAGVMLESGAVYKLTNANSGLCLDNPAGSITSGQQIAQYDDNGAPPQQWKLIDNGRNEYKIMNINSCMYLENYNASTAAGNKIIQATESTASKQKWNIVDVGTGYCKIINLQSGLCLDVSGGSTAPNALIVQNPYTGAASQKWRLSKLPVTINRYESYNMPGGFLRHEGYRGRIAGAAGIPMDTEWKVVQGLADSSMVSFESVDLPGRFLRHRGGEIWLDQNDGTQLFKDDATFKLVPGLANAYWYSFECKNYPGSYIRHRDGLLYMTTAASDLDKADATWKAK